MPLEKITQVSGTAVYVPGDDIDTDRIIPARFMKCITFDGLGEFMFYDVRKNEDGSLKTHPLNDPLFAGASIMLSGNNFGCGSSREHAPQAIAKAGFKGVIAEGFAEIFFGNSTTLGLPLAVATKEDIKAIVAAVQSDPSTEVTIDVENQRIRFGDQEVTCFIRESARGGLIAGKWDPIAELLESEKEINATAAELPYV
jgi:3-isopropylmalate/(R)-2-methylmalate dehydratase small subunit